MEIKKMIWTSMLSFFIVLTGCDVNDISNFPFSGSDSSYTSNETSSSHENSDSDSSSSHDSFLVITWCDYDGTVLEIDQNVPYGSLPDFGGITPSRADDHDYHYSFYDWGKPIETAISDQTYTARYAVNALVDIIKYIIIDEQHVGVVGVLEVEKPYVRDIFIPDTFLNRTVTEILPYGFEGLINLFSIVLPGGLVAIGEYAFSNSMLQNVNLPISLETIGAYAFYQTRISKVNIPTATSEIGYCAFLECELLEEINVDSSNSDFASISGILYNKSITTLIACPIRNNDFHDLILPSTVTSIADFACFSNMGFYSATFPSCLLSIGAYAFANGSLAYPISIPKSVQSIGDHAFAVNSMLASIEVDSGNAYYASVEGVLYDKTVSTLIQYPAGNPNISFAVPLTVSAIEKAAFAHSENLHSVDLTSDLTVISEGAFATCWYLETVMIPDSVTRIEKTAFMWNIALSNINLPDQLVFVGDHAFYGCESLKAIDIPLTTEVVEDNAFAGLGISDVFIPAKLSSIGANAFASSSLESIEVDSANQSYSSLSGVLYDKNQTKIILYPSSKLDTTFVIPESVDTVGSFAFTATKFLEHITFTSNVRILESSAFFVCTSVLSFDLNEGLMAIGDSAFAASRSLVSIHLPGTVTTIGKWAFMSCTALDSIFIPSSVLFMGTDVFSQCGEMTIYCESASKPEGWEAGWNSYQTENVVWGSANTL